MKQKKTVYYLGEDGQAYKQSNDPKAPGIRVSDPTIRDGLLNSPDAEVKLIRFYQVSETGYSVDPFFKARSDQAWEIQAKEVKIEVMGCYGAFKRRPGEDLDELWLRAMKHADHMSALAVKRKEKAVA